MFEAAAVPDACPDCYKGPLFVIQEHSFDVGNKLIVTASRVEVVRKVSSKDGRALYVVRDGLGWAQVPEEWLEASMRF